MRLIIFALAAVALVHSSPLEKSLPIHRNLELAQREISTYAFESQINNTLECVRNILKNGDPALGFPSIEPLVIDDVDLDLDNLQNPDVSGKLSLKNFKFVGLTNFRASHLKGTVTLIPTGLKLEITMSFPGTSFAGSYNGDVTIRGQHIKGAGGISGAFVNFMVPVKLHGVMDWGKIKMRSFSIKPSMQSLTFNIDNVEVNGEENSEIINNAVESFPQWLKDNVKDIDAKLSKLIMDAVNKPSGGGGGGGGIINDIINIIQKKCM